MLSEQRQQIVSKVPRVSSFLDGGVWYSCFDFGYIITTVDACNQQILYGGTRRFDLLVCP
jgi:hypothetical protein